MPLLATRNTKEEAITSLFSEVKCVVYAPFASSSSSRAIRVKERKEKVKRGRIRVYVGGNIDEYTYIVLEISIDDTTTQVAWHVMMTMILIMNDDDE